MLNNVDNFPLGALPPVMQNAVIEISNKTCTAVAQVAGLMLAIVALCCQGHLAVLLPLGNVSPLSLFTIISAISGERKSTVYNLLMTGLKEFLDFHHHRLRKLNEGLDIERTIWRTECRALEKKLSAAVQKGIDTELIKEQLRIIYLSQPVEPPVPKLIYSDTTMEALLYKLFHGWSSAGLQSSEGGLIFSSRASQDLAVLNVLWDGGELEVDRRNGDSFILRDARLSMSVMIQQGRLQAFVEKGGGYARDIGFLARCLISAPTSTIGSRFLEENLQPTPYTEKFNNKMRDLLRTHLSDDGLLQKERTILEFQPDAASEWRRFYNYIENQLGPGRYFSDVRDAASKIAENVARLAAIFHAAEGRPSSKIELVTTNAACEIGQWYLHQFKSLLGEPRQLSQEFTDARLLESWLLDKCQVPPGFQAVRKNVVRTFGPNRLREKKALDMAVGQLCREGRIRLIKNSGQWWIQLIHPLFGQSTQMMLPHPSSLLSGGV